MRELTLFVTSGTNIIIPSLVTIITDYAISPYFKDIQRDSTSFIKSDIDANIINHITSEQKESKMNSSTLRTIDSLMINAQYLNMTTLCFSQYIYDLPPNSRRHIDKILVYPQNMCMSDNLCQLGNQYIC